MIIGVLRWGWVEVILRVSLEVILRKLLRHIGSRYPFSLPTRYLEGGGEEVGRAPLRSPGRGPSQKGKY